MDDSRTFHHIPDEWFRVLLPEPANFIVVTKIKDALDDIARVFFGVNRFWVHVPKEALAEFHIPEL